MKKAQILIEYVLMSVVAVSFIIVLILAFNAESFGIMTTFGYRDNDSNITVPPMTP